MEDERGPFPAGRWRLVMRGPDEDPPEEPDEESCEGPIEESFEEPSENADMEALLLRFEFPAESIPMLIDALKDLPEFWRVVWIQGRLREMTEDPGDLIREADPKACEGP